MSFDAITSIAQAATPFMMQPWLPPSQIMPVMEDAMLFSTYSIAFRSPPLSQQTATAMPEPAACPF